MPCRRDPVRFFIAVPFLAALAGCAPATRPPADAPAAVKASPLVLAGRQWQLVDFTGEDLAALAHTQPVTLRFEAQRLSGQAPCNQMGADYRLDGDALSIGPVAATKKACIAVLKLEAAYFEALATVTRAEIVDGFLRLHGRDVVLTYTEILDR